LLDTHISSHRNVETVAGLRPTARLLRRVLAAGLLSIAGYGCTGTGSVGNPDAGADARPADTDAPTTPPKPAPPETLKDWISDHETEMTRFAHDDHVAVYVDGNVDRKDIDWIQPFVSKSFQYVKQTYDPKVQYGPRHLYVFVHQNQFQGGTISSYFDGFSDFRNALDVGADSWVQGDNIDIISHEMGHIVEGSSNGIHESPAFEVWSDSKWAEIFQYDVYVALGMKADADRVFKKFTETEDDFPRPGTHWFRDFFYPVWRDHGKAKVLAGFFRLLSEHFPTEPENDGKNPIYSRRMNLGEFVHFMSGAAGKDLRAVAEKAFGTGFGADLTQAYKDFDKLPYNFPKAP